MQDILQRQPHVAPFVPPSCGVVTKNRKYAAAAAIGVRRNFQRRSTEYVPPAAALQCFRS